MVKIALLINITDDSEFKLNRQITTVILDFQQTLAFYSMAAWLFHVTAH